MSMLSRAAVAAAARKGRGAVALTTPVLSNTVVIGGNPGYTPPTWAKTPGTVLYTLLRDGVPISDATHISDPTSYVYTGLDIGPQISLRARASNGGVSSAASNSLSYNPSLTSTTRLWWDPSTLTPGSVSAWIDRIASISADQATGTKQPLMSATAFIGTYPGVSSDGGDVLVAATSAVLSGKTSMTVVMAVRDSDTAVKVLLELTASFVANNGAIAVFTNDVTPGRLAGASRGGSGGGYRYVASADLATACVISVGFDLTATGVAQVVFIRVNGVAQTMVDSTNTSTAGTLSASPLHIFGRGTTPTLGSVAVLGNLILRESHSQDNALASIERYAGVKAGITW